MADLAPTVHHLCIGLYAAALLTSLVGLTTRNRWARPESGIFTALASMGILPRKGPVEYLAVAKCVSTLITRPAR